MLVSKVSVENLQNLSIGVKKFRSTRFLAIFTTEMIGNEAQTLYSNDCISAEKQSTEFNLKSYKEEVFWIISLKTVFENLNIVKSYDKTNPNVFVFSLPDKYKWGLTSFVQYT